MIERAQDYQLVTPVGQIDGGILPARDVAADGSAHALRVEDACFLAEAASRAWAYYKFFTSGRATMAASHCLDAEVVNNAQGLIQQCTEYGASRYVFARTPVVKGEYVMNVGGNTSIDAALGILYQGVASVPNFVGNGVSFALSTDELRKVWYNYRQIGCILAVCPLEASGTPLKGSPSMKAGGRQRYHYRDGTTSSWMTVNSASRVYFASKRYQGVWGDLDGWIEYDFAIGTVKPSSSAATTPIAFASGNEALVVMRVTTDYRIYDHTDHTSLVSRTQYFDALACWGAIDANGLLQVSSFVRGDLTAARIRDFVMDAQSGHSDLPTFAYMPEDAYMTIDIWPVAVFFYDQDMDTSGISWNWTP